MCVCVGTVLAVGLEGRWRRRDLRLANSYRSILARMAQALAAERDALNVRLARERESREGVEERYKKLQRRHAPPSAP